MENFAGNDLNVMQIACVNRARAALVLGVSVDVLKGMHRRGLIDVTRTPGGQHLLTPAALQRAHQHLRARVVA